MQSSYKVMIAGASGVGKTALVTRHRTGQFLKLHASTMGVEVHPLTFHTTHGKVTLKMWDLAGNSKYAGLGDSYYQAADAQIVLYDTTRVEETLPRARAILDNHPNLLSVMCGNKVDDLNADRSYVSVECPFFQISARSNYNYDKPFLTLLRRLANDPSLQFTEAPETHPIAVLPMALPIAHPYAPTYQPPLRVYAVVSAEGELSRHAILRDAQASVVAGSVVVSFVPGAQDQGLYLEPSDY